VACWFLFFRRKTCALTGLSAGSRAGTVFCLLGLFPCWSGGSGRAGFGGGPRGPGRKVAGCRMCGR
jgi:hypothetical protein